MMNITSHHYRIGILFDLYTSNPIGVNIIVLQYPLHSLVVTLVTIAHSIHLAILEYEESNILAMMDGVITKYWTRMVLDPYTC